MDYVDKENILQHIQANYSIDKTKNADICFAFIDFMNWLDDAPTADVAEVVRCKDCKHEHTDPFCQMWCRLHRKHEWERLVEENHFCSYGKRKTVTDTNVGSKMKGGEE